MELTFSELKTLLRKHAERTVEALWNCLDQLVSEWTPQEFQNSIRHLGYTAH